MRRWRFAEPETHRLFDRDELIAVLRGGGFEGDAIGVTPVRILGGVSGLIATAGYRRAVRVAAEARRTA